MLANTPPPGDGVEQSATDHGTTTSSRGDSVLSMNQRAYVLSSLRMLGADAYRIDWFGDVRTYGRNGVGLPFVTVVMSRWREMESACDVLHRRRPVGLPVPIAFLRLLRIGDVWSGGAFWCSDKTICREEFVGVDITNEAFDVKPAGFPMPSGGSTVYPLPFDKIDAHRGHTGAYCVRVSLPGRTTLIIPCMEVIRFYFGASGALLSRLFSGAFATQRLFTSARLNPVTGIANVSLAYGLPGVAAATVGRIAFDSNARQAMQWIVNSGTSTAVNRERYYPKTSFPFRGKTDLTAEGRWLEHGDDRVFLAERLIRCTHPFPFKALFYTSQVNLLSSKTPFQTAQGRSFNAPSGDINRRSSADIVLTDNAVAPALHACRIDVDHHAAAGPFPDLLHKAIRRVGHKRPDFGSKVASQVLGELAAGEECASGTSRAAEVTTEDEVPAEAIEVFVSAFRSLADNGAIRARLARGESGAIRSMFGMEGISRTNFLANSSNDHLAEVWYARIELEHIGSGYGLLALVRDHVNHESPSHVALIRYDSTTTPDSDFFNRLCVDFSDGKLENTRDVRVAGVLDTARATNIYHTSRFLEATINAEQQKALASDEWP